MEKPSNRRSVTERIKRQLGSFAGGTNLETGRSWAEERMIDRMTQKGGKGFRVLRSAETTQKKYSRPDTE